MQTIAHVEPTATVVDSVAARPSRRGATTAGFVYVGAWLVGLTAFPAGPALDAGGAEIERFSADHGGAVVVQGVVVHGLAAVALALVLVALQRRALTTRIGWMAGVAGIALSLLQVGLGVARGLAAAGAGSAETLFEATNRLDGLKMLAFAVMVGVTARVLRSQGVAGRGAPAIGGLTAGALVVSAVGYLTLDTALAAAAFASLPLLLLSVAYGGAVAGRAGR